MRQTEWLHKVTDSCYVTHRIIRNVNKFYAKWFLINSNYDIYFWLRQIYIFGLLDVLDVVSRCAMFRYVVSRSAMSCHATLCSAMSCHATFCSAMSCHATLCSAMSCHATFCSAMSCHATLCSAMSCHATLCSAMSCHATLCSAMSSQCVTLPHAMRYVTYSAI